MAEFSRVDVKEIKSDIPRSNFAESDIDRLADLILSCGGVLRPLIVKQVDIDNFVLIDGFLEYYGAVRAREKDPRRGELVNAFVVSPKDDLDIVQQQIAALSGTQAPTPPTTQLTTPHIPQSQEGASAWISSFETRLSETREEAFQSDRNLEIRVSQIEKRLAEKRQDDLLTFINHAEKLDLISKLSALNGSNQTKAEAIYDARSQKENGQFNGYQDLQKSTERLGSDGLLGLIDNWHRIYDH